MTNERVGCGKCTMGYELHRFDLRDDKQVAQIATHMESDGTVRSIYIDLVKRTEMNCVKNRTAKYQFCPECGRPCNLRPMTLDEAVAYGRPVVREVKQPDDSSKCYWVLPHELQTYSDFPPARYWESKPTPEQSAAHPWREEDA